MYLKALEIQGFKSFPEKIRLPFMKEVTAIVGPNGSGKSNISDALSWVMGEQRSKALRGTKMEDVIFGGAEQRSQLGFAQVSLIINNENGLFDLDSQELMITRRYYRSGESEYFINKRVVRLKDVNEILMDTGLGRDGYSIIGQGRVDEILSAKSEDRREVFEEAAGISKFRYRKDEAERKLERTNDNLIRANDKISELEMQVGPLKTQAETAKKYLVLRDELRVFEVSLWMLSLERLAAQAVKLGGDYESLAAQLEDEKQRLEKLYADDGRLTEDIQNKDMEAERIRAEISEAEAHISEYEGEIAVIKTNMQNNLEGIERLESEIQDNRADAVREQIAGRKKRILEIESETELIAGACSELIAECGRTGGEAGEKEREISELLEEASALENKASALGARRTAVGESIAELAARLSGSGAEFARLHERLETESQLLSEKEAELAKALEEEGSLDNMTKGYELRLKTRAAKLSELDEQKTKLDFELGALASRLSLLSDMEKEHEGFSNAVKTVMRERERGNLRNIHGTVADIIKTGDKYTVAIETALGASMQSIIVSREEDGKSAISLLKQRDSGRATFLPLSTVKGSETAERGLGSEEGVEGIASRLVSFGQEYTGIVMNLLGRTIIVDMLDTAIRLSRKYSARFRIVTLDGQVINAGGSMTGGSAVRSVGILSRSNELLRLTARQKELQNARSELAAMYSEAEREYNAARYEFETASADARTRHETVTKLESELFQRKVLTDSLKGSLAAQNASENEIFPRLEKAQNELRALEEQEREVCARAEALRKNAVEKAGGQEEIRNRIETLNAGIARYREKEASLNAEKSAILKALSEWELHLESLISEKEQKLSGAESLRERNKVLRQKLESTEASAGEQRSELVELRGALSAALNAKMETEALRTRTQKQAQEKNREIMELEREFSRLEQKKLAAELEERQITDKLWDTYELSRSAGQRIRIEIESIPKAQKRVSELKSAITKLGTPNLGAIEEFERVNTRYTYLVEQRDDITQAKKELEKIVRDITAEMKVIFSREFDTINSSFKETFTELFGGGRAELLLEDEDDILNCGIEIKVQPPGKTLRTLSLLSGGERAFVAIALYFAIMKVRPTPFCVLDEIETALDEKNVERFAKYLRRMSDRTQFLVITHRRGTMEEADVLFGVTMQKGISKVLSIDLEEALKTQ